MSYFFNEAARVEHLEHVAYYESCQMGLGARYLLAFDVAMGAVCEAPDRCRASSSARLLAGQALTGRPRRMPAAPLGFDVNVHRSSVLIYSL